MIARKKYIFFTFWLVVIAGLIVLSVRFKTSDDAIVAVVEPQRVAISFPKATKLRKIHVVPGQKVSKGDTLFIAERPNLIIDIDKTVKSLNSQQTELENLQIRSRSELNLTRIEKRNKLNEIDKDIEQIQAQINYNRRRMSQLKSLSDKEIPEEAADSPAVLKLKALKEEGVYTILINPNIATVQTSEGIAVQFLRTSRIMMRSARRQLP